MPNSQSRRRGCSLERRNRRRCAHCARAHVALGRLAAQAVGRPGLLRPAAGKSRRDSGQSRCVRSQRGRFHHRAGRDWPEDVRDKGIEASSVSFPQSQSDVGGSQSNAMHVAQAAETQADGALGSREARLRPEGLEHAHGPAETVALYQQETALDENHEDRNDERPFKNFHNKLIGTRTTSEVSAGIGGTNGGFCGNGGGFGSFGDDGGLGQAGGGKVGGGGDGAGV
eukprot:6192948-Pleurochrysis_carterae.AAC.2